MLETKRGHQSECRKSNRPMVDAWARLVIFDSFAADSEQELRSELLQVIRENVSFNPAQSRF
jgi:hypothetical protein